MDKRIKIYIAIFIAIVGGIVYADASKAKPISWFSSYAAKHKIPYGTYVLKQQLSRLFPNTEVKEIKQNPFVYLNDTTRKGTYFFVDGLINFDPSEFRKILAFVARGNTVFIATNGVNIDTLGLKTKKMITTSLKENFKVSLLNPLFNKEDFTFDKPASNLIFSEIDSLKTIALGKLSVMNKEGGLLKEGVNFIKHQHEKGYFIFHTAPLLFTNYNILKANNYRYVENALSYVPTDQPLLWDTYYKTGKTKMTSPMQFVLTSKSLKWAYYMLLIAFAFFILFKSKRIQRFIPIVLPLKNQTVAFTKTIANMYYEKSEHKNIATHKIAYFLEHIRTKLHIATSEVNESFYEQLSARSGNDKADIILLFNTIETIYQSGICRKEQLITLNQQIESFMDSQSISSNNK